jgi:hypothetical protein
MPKYLYRHDLPPHENRRRAIELHSLDGPPAAIVVGQGWDSEAAGWIFPDGASMPAGGGSMPIEPADKPPAGAPWVSYEAENYRDTLRRIALYWSLRTERASRAFDQLREQALQSPTEDAVRRLEQLLGEAQHCKARQGQAEAAYRSQFVQRLPSADGEATAKPPVAPSRATSMQEVALQRRIAAMQRG